MLWGIYSAICGEVNVAVEKCVEIHWKTAKLFYFCHLKKLVRPETFGPYYVHLNPHSVCSNLMTQYNVTVVITNPLIMPGWRVFTQVALRTYAAALCLCYVNISSKRLWLIQRSSPGCWWIGYDRRSTFRLKNLLNIIRPYRNHASSLRLIPKTR